MRIKFIGNYTNDIIPLFLNYTSIERVENNPDLIVTYGGDGSLLYAERKFPGVKKFPIRDDKNNPVCAYHDHKTLIENFVEDKLSISQIMKIYGKRLSNQKVHTGINDIFVHNINRRSAIRYKVWIDDKLYLKEVASDCFGISTPHGSSGYFQSITNCIFKTGIGIAFSNSREHVNHIILPESSTIKIKILRGPALMLADNEDNESEGETLSDSDEILIKKSDEKAEIIGLEEFMCHDCRKLRHMKL